MYSLPSSRAQLAVLALSSACITLSGTSGCGGGQNDLDAGGDGGRTPSVDAPRPLDDTPLIMRDAGCMPGVTTSTSVDFHTVTSAVDGTTDLDGVAVRAESPCAPPMEMTTDATGDLTMVLPDSGRPWSVTFAKARYSVVSIMDVTGAAFAGDVRLDELGPFAGTTFPVSGTVTGASAGNTVQIDTFDFDTTSAAAGAWSSQFYVSIAAFIRPPLRFVALELDAAGNAVNFAAAPEAMRTETAVTGVTLALPTPRAPVITTRIRYHLPTSGLADAAGSTILTFNASHTLFDIMQQPYVLTGTARLEPGVARGDQDLVVRHFGGDLDANFSGLLIQGAGAYLNVIASEMVDAEVTVPPVLALSVAGSSFESLEAFARGDGYDYLVVHLGEDESTDPRWRVIARASGGSASIAAVPHLPTSVSLSEVGLGEGGVTSTIPIFLRMARSEPWSIPGMNQTQPNYAYAAGGPYGRVVVTP